MAEIPDDKPDEWTVFDAYLRVFQWNVLADSLATNDDKGFIPRFSLR